MKQGLYLGASTAMWHRTRKEHLMGHPSGSWRVARALQGYGDTLEAKLPHCALLTIIDLHDLGQHPEFWPSLFGTSDPTLPQAKPSTRVALVTRTHTLTPHHHTPTPTPIPFHTLHRCSL